MPYIIPPVSPTGEIGIHPEAPQPTLLWLGKTEKLDPIIELTSDSDSESPCVHQDKLPYLVHNTSKDISYHNKPANTPNSTPIQSLFCTPTKIDAIAGAEVSIMDCLKRLSSVPHSRNELSTMDVKVIKHHWVQYLPPTYNGNVIFELPPCRTSLSSSAARNLDEMDKRYDGHLWCKLITTFIIPIN